MKTSVRLRAVKPSATFAMAAEATALRNRGQDIVDLSVGEPDFDTPEHVKAAARDAMARGLTKYTPIGGTDELKDAISTKLRRDNGLEYGRSEVMASCGGKHSLYTAFQALFDEGDEVVLPAPYWVSYPEMVVLAGAVPRIVPTTAARGFRMAPEELEAALGPRTVAVAAAATALVGPQDSVAAMAHEFTERLQLMVEGLGTIPGVHLVPPQGAFYVFPDLSAFFGRRGPDGAVASATDLSMYLLRHAGVASVPGEGFGAPAHVRFSYAAARPLLEEGLARVKRALAALR